MLFDDYMRKSPEIAALANVISRQHGARAIPVPTAPLGAGKGAS